MFSEVVNRFSLNLNEFVPTVVFIFVLQVIFAVDTFIDFEVFFLDNL